MLVSNYVAEQQKNLNMYLIRTFLSKARFL